MTPTSFLEQVPLALVLGAGFVTLLSPCGYVLLPAYISYLLGGKVTIKGALRGTLVSVMGIFLVFGAAGLAVGLASQLIQSIVPHLTLVAGVIILILGASKAFEFSLPLMGLPSRFGGKIRPGGFFVYGLIYAFTASGCTFPIFFAVVLYASLAPGLGALVTMLTYAFGVAVPLIATGVLAARASQEIITRAASIAPKLHRASGVILMAAGAYLIYYYYTNFLATTL